MPHLLEKETFVSNQSAGRERGDFVKKSSNLRGFVTRSTHNGNALGHHGLVARLSVQISRAHEAGLGWVRVDPPDNREPVVDAVF